MGFPREVTCQRCGKKYSILRTHCPDCDTPRPRQSTRAAATTASALSGTAARARAAMDGRWQLVFAAVLAAAVLLATIVLIAGGDKVPTAPVRPGSSSGESAPGAITISDTYLPTPSPSPEPTPVAPRETITSLELVFLNNTLQPDVTLSKDGQIEIQLEVRTFPQNVDVKPVWSSSNENVLTVDETGKVTVVGCDPVNGSNATITVECDGLTASSIIRVPQYQAAHLKENRFNAG